MQAIARHFESDPIECVMSREWDDDRGARSRLRGVTRLPPFAPATRPRSSVGGTPGSATFDLDPPGWPLREDRVRHLAGVGHFSGRP